jgi:3-methylcrotonyl-CoA carboxylase alpha subunit
MFHKVLIANRGEIAVRIAATCQALGVVAAVVYTDTDRDALHVRVADEAYPLGTSTATDSYLNVEAVMQAAERAGADALHPGYGFLSENPALAAACAAAGVTFVGPSPDAMRLLGSKIAAKRLAAQAGVPTVHGYDGADQDDATLLARAQDIGAPLLIKASAGGGGRGMREVHDLALFPEALAAARREARGAFGDDTVLLERLVREPRHIEFQVFGDAHGNVIHLGERECSVQRRHQKIIEEAPSPALSPESRAEMGAAAVRVTRAAGYTNAGTAEFMRAPDGAYYFLEMNARLQVEHPVTELVTGLDLVALQLRVAAGEPLPLAQEDVALRGHALECRVYAEDPAAGFLPSTGRLALFDPPRGPGVRVDTGVATGDEVTVYYDPMLAKLITSGETRAEAIARGQRALRRFPVLGVTTNIAFLARAIGHPAFVAGHLSTSFVSRHLADTGAATTPTHDALLLAALWQTTAPVAPPPDVTQPYDPWRAPSGWTLAAQQSRRFMWGGAEYTVELEKIGARAWSARAGDDLYDVSGADRDPGVTTVGGLTLRIDGHVVRGYLAETATGTLQVAYDGGLWELELAGPPDVDHVAGAPGAGGVGGSLAAPMPGTIIRVDVKEGDRVEPRQRLVVLEAMKMEHVVEAPYGGVVRVIRHHAGDLVAAGATLVEIEEG